MRHLPIRLRLTLVYAAVMVMVLGIVGVYAYSRLAAGFDSDLNRELKQRVDDVSGPLHRPANTLTELVGHGFIEHGESFAELLNPAGNVLQTTDTLHGQPLLRRQQAARASRSRTFFDVPNAPGLNEPARLLASPVALHGRRLVIVVGATRENGLETLAGIRSRMLVAAPLLLLLTSLMAYVLAGEALRPVERLRRQAERLKATTGGRRLHVPATHDEIARLAGTLNDLLAVVESSVERERRFLANASHELRTPLALLRIELDLAARRPRSATELRRTIDSASAEVDRLVSLANDLLVLARETDAGLPVNHSPVRLDHVVEECASRMRTDAERHIVMDAKDAVTIWADGSRIRQAVDNLVENAAVHGRGTITVSVVPAEDWVEVHVLDEGPGLEPELAARAFERFSHGAHSRGAGLGLAIVDQIARAHGGSAFTRTSPGGGADVWLRLPGAPTRQARAGPANSTCELGHCAEQPQSSGPQGSGD